MPRSSRRDHYNLSPVDTSPATEFEYSVEIGDTKAVRKVIVRHKMVPKWLTPSLRYRLLCISVYHKDRVMVALLLKLQPVFDLEPNTERILSPLWIAVRYYQEEIVRLLIEAGANIYKRLGPNEDYDPDYTILHYLIAAYNPQKSRKLIDLMIEHGADVNAVDSTGLTPLHYAVFFGKTEIASKLIFEGANVNAKNVNGITPLLWACKGRSRKEIIKLLIEKGADILVQTPDRCNALHLLAMSRFEVPDVAEILLKQDVSLCVIDREKQYTPLHYAVLNRKKKLTKIFLEHGADANGWEECREFPLCLAAAQISPIIIKMLVNYGAKLEYKTNGGQTALHVACKNKQEKNILALLQYGANINALDDEGATPFSLIKNNNINGSTRVMIRTIAKCTVLNRPTNKIDLDIIKEYPELQKFYDDCMKEIDKMRRIKLFENITYFPLFIKSVVKLALVFRNNRIKASLRVKKIKKLFPIYSGEFNFAIRMAKALNKDSYRIEHDLYDVFANKLPDTVLRKIMIELLARNTRHEYI